MLSAGVTVGNRLLAKKVSKGILVGLALRQASVITNLLTPGCRTPGTQWHGRCANFFHGPVASQQLEMDLFYSPALTTSRVPPWHGVAFAEFNPMICESSSMTLNRLSFQSHFK